jgi:hypothetical protein
MTPEQKIKLKKYTRAIAEILYTEGESEQKPTLESIEKTIQAQLQQYVSQEIATFFLSNQQEQLPAEPESLQDRVAYFNGMIGGNPKAAAWGGNKEAETVTQKGWELGYPKKDGSAIVTSKPTN